MKFRQKIFSLVATLALACGMAGGAQAARTAARVTANGGTAQTVPAVTLELAQGQSSSVSVGDTVKLTLSVDSTRAPFSLCTVDVRSDRTGLSQTLVQPGTMPDGVTAELQDAQVSQNEPVYSHLVLTSTKSTGQKLTNAAVYTFTAQKAGTYTISVSGSCSAAGSTSGKAETSLTGITPVTVTVNPKILTATPSEDSRIIAVYGDDPADAAEKTDVSFFCDGEAVSDLTGSWAYKGSVRPGVKAVSVMLTFTPQDTNYAPVKVEFPAEIIPRTITARLSVEPAEKAFDGTAAAGKATVTLEGVLDGDDAAAQYDSSAAVYAHIQAGDDEQSITLSGITLTGSDAENYALADSSASVSGRITPYTGEVTVAESFVQRRYHTGEQPLTGDELTLTDSFGNVLVYNQDYTVTYPDGCTGSEAEDTEVRYELTGQGNYAGCSFTGNTGRFTILHRTVPTAAGTLGEAVSVLYGEAFTAPGTDSVQAVGTDGSSVQGTLSLRYKADGAPEWQESSPTLPGRYAIGVYFESADPRYSSGILEGVSGALTIQKAAGSGSLTTDKSSYVYGETISVIPSSDTNGTESVTYRYTGTGSTVYDSDQTPVQAGSYSVTAVFAETDCYTQAQAAAEFTIVPKELRDSDFSLDTMAIVYNGSIQTPTVNSVLTLNTDYTLSIPDSVKPGDYAVTATGQGSCTGTVTLNYKIVQAIYIPPADASISTVLSEYPVSLYGGQPVTRLSLRSTGLPEGTQYGWKAGSDGSYPTLPLSAGEKEFTVSVDPRTEGYISGTYKVSVKLTALAPIPDSAEAARQQAAAYTAAVSKAVTENGTLQTGASADLASVMRSDKLTVQEQNVLKTELLNSVSAEKRTELLKVLDNTTASVSVTSAVSGTGKRLTSFAVQEGGKAALGAANGSVTYTARDTTPDNPANGQLVSAALTMTSGSSSLQPAVPVLVQLQFRYKDLDMNGSFRIQHSYQSGDKAVAETLSCLHAARSGEFVTIQFYTASFGDFTVEYTAPGSGSSSGSSGASAAAQPSATAEPALSASELTWLSGYSALLNAGSGSTLKLDVTGCEYLPGYIIGGVAKSGVTLELSTPAGTLRLTPAAAKAMNSSYNYTFADALAIAGKVKAAAAASSPAATAAPSPTAAPTATPVPTPAVTPSPAPTTAPAPTAAPQSDSQDGIGAVPVVAGILIAALVLAGGWLIYNKRSSDKHIHTKSDR